MQKLLKDCFTDASGEAWEWASIAGGVVFLAFLGFSFYHYVVLKTPFDPISFGSGFSAIAAGTGAHKLMSAKGDASQ